MWPIRKSTPERLAALREENRRLAGSLGRANARLNMLEADVVALGAANDRLTQARDRRDQVIVVQREAIDDLAREVVNLKADRETQAELIQEREQEIDRLSGKVRDADAYMARQAGRTERLELQAERDRVSIKERDRGLCEAQTTIAGLGLEIASYERAFSRDDERRQFMAEDHAHVRLMDGAGDQ